MRCVSQEVRSSWRSELDFGPANPASGKRNATENDPAAPLVWTGAAYASTMKKTSASEDQNWRGLTVRTHMEQMDDLRARMDRFEVLVGNLVEVVTSRVIRGSMQPSQVDIGSGRQADISRTVVDPSHLSNGGQPSASLQTEPGFLPGIDAASTGLNGLAQLSSAMRYEAPISDHGKREGEGDGEFQVRMTTVCVLTPQRLDGSGGALMRYGPTSLWTHKSSPRQVLEPRYQPRYQPIIGPGDRVDWSKYLPEGVGLTKIIHDRALGLFASYYGPWGMTVDLSAFMADMATCNLVSPTGYTEPRPVRTVHYSPLLHCCVLYLGLVLMRREQPELLRNMEAIFWDHTSKLLILECDQAALSSLRAYNLLAT